MLRASVMASDTMVVDAIASILTGMVCPDILQLSYCEPRTTYKALYDRGCVVIDIDEGESQKELIMASGPFRLDNPLLVFHASIKIRNIHLFEVHPLVRSDAGDVVDLVRDTFKKTFKEDLGSGLPFDRNATCPHFDTQKNQDQPQNLLDLWFTIVTGINPHGQPLGATSLSKET